MKFFLAAAIAVSMLMPAYAADAAKANDPPKVVDAQPTVPPPVVVADPVKLTVSRQTLLTLGKALMELPFKESSAILNDLQAQLNAADKEAADAAATKAKPPEKPAEPKAK